MRWHRCLRCDSWLPLDPPADPARRHPPERDEIELPLRGRPLRDKFILRLIAVDKTFRFLLFGALAVGVFLIAANENGVRDLYYRLLADFRGDSELPQHGLLHEIDRLLNLHTGTLELVGVGLAAYAVLQATEAVGLWMTKRWAEYLTFIATGLFVPLEVWELTLSQTPLKIARAAAQPGDPRLPAVGEAALRGPRRGRRRRGPGRPRRRLGVAAAHRPALSAQVCFSTAYQIRSATRASSSPVRAKRR